MSEETPPVRATVGADGMTVGAVELRHVADFVAVTLTTMGEYALTGEPFRRLTAWTDAIGVLPIGNAVCVFYSLHVSGSADPLRYSLCLPVSRPDARTARAALAAPGIVHAGEPSRPESAGVASSALAESDVVEVREFPRILAAVAYYRGSASESGVAYGAVATWVQERPYLPTGAPREVYLVAPDRAQPGLLEIEVQQPIIPRTGGSRHLR